MSQHLILCSTTRLARSLQQAHARQCKMQGLSHWQALAVRTLNGWLEEIATKALLTGAIPAAEYPTSVLSPYAEKLLWQQAIAQCLERHEYSALFDVASLAQSAQQANQLLIEWQIEDSQFNHDFISAETRQFLRWRAVFRDLCQRHDALEPARILALQADIVKRLHTGLPQSLTLQGFDRITPLLQHLLQILRDKGTAVTLAEVKATQPKMTQTTMDDIDAECRAAVAWAKAMLQAHPQAKLAIISPVLANIRRRLQDLLDDTFHPETLHFNQAESPRIYDFSLGEPLAQIPLIHAALNLLRFSCHPRQSLQADVSTLLLDVYWGAWEERDLRASIDATMRQTCMRSMDVERLLALVEKSAHDRALHGHVQAVQTFRQETKKRPPSAWILAFQALLESLQWATTRPLSSHEFQAKRAWDKLLQSINQLDLICGNVSAHEAVRLLRQLCMQQLHQPESEVESRIQVLGILEQPAEALDGVWVIGMNDVNWPPSPRPNPLLPYALQRTHAMPGADSAAQAQFGQQIFTRLCHCAKEVMFSYAKHEGERELRPSPLLSKLPQVQMTSDLFSLAERLANPARLEALDDQIAPPVLPGENVRGGTKLLEAQAICPAWAFYQYRLGARKLEEPTDGLDQMLRGNLVHAALQQFWEAHHDSAVLRRADLHDLIAGAVDAAIAKHDLTAFPDALLQIERHRLNLLLQTWLALEAERTPFAVHACEQAQTVDLQGLQIHSRIDRIDRLDEGLLVIDYKTGNLPNMAAWTDERISEPQLPFYASIVLQDEQVIGACFARVNIEQCKLEGASEANIGADSKPMQTLRSHQKLAQFDGFEALLTHWQTQLNQIATEIMQGVADVRFTDETDLTYCDIKPLLRLPERAWQFENLQQNQEVAHD